MIIHRPVLRRMIAVMFAVALLSALMSASAAPPVSMSMACCDTTSASYDPDEQLDISATGADRCVSNCLTMAAESDPAGPGLVVRLFSLDFSPSDLAGRNDPPDPLPPRSF